MSAPKLSLVRWDLNNNEQAMMVGLIDVFLNQTETEVRISHTYVKNDIGFNAGDAARLTNCVRWLLKQTTETALRNNPNAKLDDYFDEWAAEMIKKRIPKYARQIWSRRVTKYNAEQKLLEMFA